MASTEYDSRSRGGQEVSGWAVGGLVFAASILILIGVFQIIAGLVAVFNDEFFVVARHYTFHLDVTAWGCSAAGAGPRSPGSCWRCSARC